MLVTVAICTWNRAKLLDQTLERMAGLHVPAGVEWELLVVNNNCTDDTDAVLARHAANGQLPLRRLYEPTPGQSNARNRAIVESRGELIVWTDDDVLVDANWLAAYSAARAKWPDATYFGGPIRPWYERTPPPWLPTLLTHAKHLWAVLDLGPDSRHLTTGEYPFGANLAVDGDTQRKHPFDPRTGHSAGKLAGGDETTLLAHLTREGHRGVWVGDAVVEHFIPADRMTVEYVRTRASQFGYQNHNTAPDAASKRVWGIPGYVLSQYVKHALACRLYPLVSMERWAVAVYQSARWGGAIRRVREERQRSGVGAAT